MDNPVLAAPVVAILGLIVPFLVSFLKTAKAAAWVNQAVALAVCIAAGAASVAIDAGSGGLTLAALLGHAGGDLRDRANGVSRVVRGDAAERAP